VPPAAALRQVNSDDGHEAYTFFVRRSFPRRPRRIGVTLRHREAGEKEARHG
jgi:hypothetical protein